MKTEGRGGEGRVGSIGVNHKREAWTMDACMLGLCASSSSSQQCVDFEERKLVHRAWVEGQLDSMVVERGCARR